MNETVRNYHEQNLQRRAEMLCQDLCLPQTPKFRFVDKKQNQCVMDPEKEVIDISLIDYYFINSSGNGANTLVHELLHGFSLFYNPNKRIFQAKGYSKTVGLSDYYQSLISHKIYDETLAVYGSHKYGTINQLTVPEAQTWQLIDSVNRHKATALDLIDSGVFEKAFSSGDYEVEKSCNDVFQNAAYLAGLLGMRLAELMALYQDDLSLRGFLFANPNILETLLEDFKENFPVVGEEQISLYLHNLIESDIHYQENM